MTTPPVLMRYRNMDMQNMDLSMKNKNIKHMSPIKLVITVMVVNRFSIPSIGYMCAPDELLRAGVDLVPCVGLVSVAGDDQPDLGGPGPVLGQLDELLVVARHQSAHGAVVSSGNI